MSDQTCIDSYQHIFTPNLLAGKTALVTGGGSGIGFTISEILLRHSCNVVICSRKYDRLCEAVAVFKNNFVTTAFCLPIRMDVRNEDDVDEAVTKAVETFGKIDILVNCAAGNFLSPIAGLSLNAFKTVMNIDAVGTFLVSKKVFENSMRDNGGVILNITATIHYRGTPFQAHAGAAKAAVDALTKHMAVEWGANDIRVVGIAPGPISDTEGLRRLSARSDIDVKDIIPLGRIGTRLDIAHLALFLASDASNYISGETIVADGGQWLASTSDFGITSKI